MKALLLRVNVWAFLGTVILAPIAIGYAVREPWPVSYLNILSLIVIGLAAVNLLLGSLKIQRIHSRSLTVVICLFALMLLWGTFFSEPLRSALGPWLNRFLQPILVGYIGYLLVSQRHISKTELYDALGTSLAVATLYGLAQLTGLTESHKAGRVTGPYDFPNSFARILGFLLLVIFPYLLLENKRWPLLRWTVWLAGVVVLLSTISYAGVGSFVLGLLVTIACLPKTFGRLKVTAGVSALAVIILASLFWAQLPKSAATLGSSLQTRQQFWVVAWETVKAHPFTGIGLEGWERQYVDLAHQYLVFPRKAVLIEWVSSQPHNIYLDASLRGGILGFIAILSFMIWPIWYGLKNRSGGAAAYAGIGLGVMLLTFGLVDDPIFSDEAILMLVALYFAFIATKKPAG